MGGVLRAALAALLITSTALADPPPAVRLPDGSCHLPAERCESVGRDLARLRAENAELRRPPAAPVAVIVTLVVLALGVGFAAGKAAR